MVNVGCQDMALLGEIGSLPDDVVFPVVNLADEGCSFCIDDNFHPVAYGDRISATDAFESEVPLYLTFDVLSVIGVDKIPASGVFCNESVHLDGHDFLVLCSVDIFYLFDVLVVHLLKLFLATLLCVFGQTVFN